MTDLRKLSERANRFNLHYDEDDDTLFSGGPGSDVIAFGMLPNDAEYLCALWNEHRSGSLIPRSEYERVRALLAEAREAFGAVLALQDNTSPFGGELMHDRIERTLERARATLSRIDDALASEPEAKA